MFVSEPVCIFDGERIASLEKGYWGIARILFYAKHTHR